MLIKNYFTTRVEISYKIISEKTILHDFHYDELYEIIKADLLDSKKEKEINLKTKKEKKCDTHKWPYIKRKSGKNERKYTNKEEKKT